MVRNLLALCAVFAPIALFACGNSSSTTTTTGTGGTTAASTTAGTGGTTTDATTGASTTASTGAGTGGASGACTNAADSAIVADPAKDVSGAAANCGKMTFGAEPATKDCVKMATGLSDGCAQCFGDTIGCVVNNCITPCLADSAGACCAICRSTNCDPAFAACSGITPNPPPPPPDGGC
jgi:hypothetical protein